MRWLINGYVACIECRLFSFSNGPDIDGTQEHEIDTAETTKDMEHSA